jgi:hypothetical protein
MTNKRWIASALWTLLFWTLVFAVISTPPEDIPYCSSYEDC